MGATVHTARPAIAIVHTALLATAIVHTALLATAHTARRAMAIVHTVLPALAINCVLNLSLNKTSFIIFFCWYEINILINFARFITGFNMISELYELKLLI